MEIQEIVNKVVAENALNRLRFHEVSKMNHHGILHKMVDGFVNQTKHWQQSLDIAKMGCYKMTLKKGMFQPKVSNWPVYLFELIRRQDEMLYLVYTERKKDGKVKFILYEGFIKEIVKVLLESGAVHECYIVSRNFDWLISSNKDGVVYCVGDTLEKPYLEFVKKRADIITKWHGFE